MTHNYDKLIAILEEIFQLNQADLDFGIYRIMNQKRDEIKDFLHKRLVPQVKDIIAGSNLGDSAQIRAELDKLIATLRDAGMEPNASPKVQELQEKLKAAPSPESLENEIFSHLASFFRRYYKDGDFISMRRYKKDVYAIPYEGEEVKLHWANHDQYYIKTSEYLKNYGFKLPNDRLVRFELAEASTEKDNRKEESGKERRFKIFDEKPLEVQGNTLTVFFTYEPTDKKEKQEDLNAAAADAVKQQLPPDWTADLLRKQPTDKNKDRTLLDKHIRDFSARNTFDYFIHKDLGGFLTRELDFYIKNEVVHLDDVNFDQPLDFQKQLVKVQALRGIGSKIIAFLAQLENFQKKLWLKKKFVVDTQYCITLDRIPEALYPEIVANDAQRQEWVRLFAIDELKADLVQPAYAEPLTVGFLKSQPYLVLDTAFFPEDFKHRLLASFDNLDEQLDGLLINSENFQALNLLQERYREQVKCVYIDPPYNSDASAILYKNDYKESSFLSLVQNRIELSRELLSNEGVISVAIDDVEVAYLRLLLSDIFPKEIGIAVVRSNPQSRKARGKFSPVHEYALFFGKSESSMPASIGYSEGKLTRYPLEDEKGRYAWMNFVRAGTGDMRTDRPTLYYPIVVDENDKMRIPKMTWESSTQEYILEEELLPNEKMAFPIKTIDGVRIEKRWQRGYVRVSEELDEYRVRRDENGEIIIDFKTRMDEEALPVTWWDKNEYASSNYGANEQKELFGEKLFDFPKAKKLVEDAIKACGVEDKNEIILDYFSGSGTTGEAVINLNREDGGRRKYILVEMGQYFDTVTKPRIQKVIHSAEWKDGKPVGRQGSSHAFKYLRLESYEDSLNNLRLSRQPQQQQLLDLNERFHEEYLLHYWLDVESEGSLLSTAAFERPFDYQLNITQNNESVPTRIDLVETFNYLIGLKVKTTERIRGLHVVTGETLDGQQVLVIWRNLTGEGAVTNAALDEFFQKRDYSTRDREFDRIYVNGDNNLENLKTGDEQWKVGLVEEVFFGAMFEGGDL